MILHLYLITGSNTSTPRALVAAHYPNSARLAVGAPKSWRTIDVGYHECQDRGASLPGYRKVVLEFRPMKAPAGISSPVRSAPRDPDTESVPGRALAAAAAAYNVHPGDARYRRTQECSRAKAAAWMAMVQHGGWTQAGAGRAFGHHHSTVIAAMRKAERLVLARDPAFVAALAAACVVVSPPDAGPSEVGRASLSA